MWGVNVCAKRTQHVTKLTMDRKLSFRKAPSSEYLANLEAACQWLSVESGRAARLRHFLGEFVESDERSREHILAYSKSREIVDLFGLWEHRIADFPGLDKKMWSVFRKGPLLREDKKAAASSNRPRNDAFVYLVAGLLLKAGLQVVAVAEFGEETGQRHVRGRFQLLEQRVAEDLRARPSPRERQQTIENTSNQPRI